jgi:MauM/NapG family ferredoxin protein
MDCTRRQFFVGFAKALVPVPADEGPANQELPAREWLRPPGALPEDEFLEACVRCTDCIEACPHQSIRRLGPEHGTVAGTPAIIPQDTPCYLCEDLPCITACTPRALVPTDRASIRMGSARLKVDTCLISQGQRCDYCVTCCPLKGSAITWGSDGIPSIHKDHCTGCAVCAYLCPADAIVLQPAET